ncbi:PDZ domain-containing protein [Gammaproteobacteria bacterium]|nr:PDZ domain-containing protein [Gammaproteobacteria bacterium]|tara:strand:+ start:1663 stop:2712 length:1050 start_codon:yes stop_codon:yes gene_type:complete
MKYLVVVSFLAFLTTNINAQSGQRSVLSKDQLDYYLIQSFIARDSTKRIALNHVGLQGQQKNKGFLVTSVLEGYPAHAAGINRGDIIETVNGEPFHPINSFNPERDANGKFSPNLRENTLSLTRAGNNENISIAAVYENLFDSYRSATSNSVLEFSAGNKIIGYIRFWGLSRGSNEIINYQMLVKDLGHTDGIIFDFRDSFGFLGPEHLDLVFPNQNNSSTFQNISNRTDSSRSIFLESQIKPYRKPIALLLNKGTRGGPELFAYQLDKLERVVSVGESTKGMIGRFNFEGAADDSDINYASDEALLIDGQPLESLGVKPERIIFYPYENTTRGDPQFEAAINILLGII